MTETGWKFELEFMLRISSMLNDGNGISDALLQQSIVKSFRVHRHATAGVASDRGKNSREKVENHSKKTTFFSLPAKRIIESLPYNSLITNAEFNETHQLHTRQMNG